MGATVYLILTSSGSDIATIAPPAPMLTPSLVITAVRITMFRSTAPFSPMYPILPEYTPRGRCSRARMTYLHSSHPLRSVPFTVLTTWANGSSGAHRSTGTPHCLENEDSDGLKYGRCVKKH